MRTSGSIAARSDGWYICFTPAFYRRPGGSERADTRRPCPVDRVVCRGDGAAAARFGRPEDDDPVDLRRPTRLGAPELGDLTMRVDVVCGDASQAKTLRRGSGFPHPLRKVVAVGDRASAIR